MKDLYNTKALVKEILQKDATARNSDDRLYYLVVQNISREKGFMLDHMSIAYFLRNREELDVPGFETVRRARQKIQAECPELRPCEKIEAMRMHNESVFKEFAQSN